MKNVDARNQLERMKNFVLQHLRPFEQLDEVLRASINAEDEMKVLEPKRAKLAEEILVLESTLASTKSDAINAAGRLESDLASVVSKNEAEVRSLVDKLVAAKKKVADDVALLRTTLEEKKTEYLDGIHRMADEYATAKADHKKFMDELKAEEVAVEGRLRKLEEKYDTLKRTILGE